MPKKRVLTKPVPKRMRPNAQYVSAGKQEYIIEQRGKFWKIVKYKGGKNHPQLDQTFTTFGECERELIKFLRSTDRLLRKAVWPGRKLTNSTAPSSPD